VAISPAFPMKTVEIPEQSGVSNYMLKAMVPIIIDINKYIKPIMRAAGDQKAFSFDTNLDILLHHTEGVTVFINGETIQDIRSQQTPVRLIFSVEPKSITIKHYSKTG